MIFCRKEKQDAWCNTIMDQISNPESGDLTGIRVAYCAFATRDAELILWNYLLNDRNDLAKVA